MLLVKVLQATQLLYLQVFLQLKSNTLNGQSQQPHQLQFNGKTHHLMVALPSLNSLFIMILVRQVLTLQLILLTHTSEPLFFQGKQLVKLLISRLQHGILMVKVLDQMYLLYILLLNHLLHKILLKQPLLLWDTLKPLLLFK